MPRNVHENRPSLRPEFKHRSSSGSWYDAFHHQEQVSLARPQPTEAWLRGVRNDAMSGKLPSIDEHVRSSVSQTEFEAMLEETKRRLETMKRTHAWDTAFSNDYDSILQSRVGSQR
jgi:hypothetical protein